MRIEALPRREREIFEILCSAGEATAADVRRAMADPPSHSAVRTMLARLEAKGLVRHRLHDLAYVYKSVPQPAKVRETAIKAKNLKRDPRASLCVISDGFFGEWVQVDGTATVVTLPDALEGLVDYYRKVAGEHPDWDDYRNAMQREQRVLVRIDLERAGPTKSG